MGWSVVDAYDDLLGVRTWIDDPGTSHAHGSTSGWTPYKNWSFVLKSLLVFSITSNMLAERMTRLFWVDLDEDSMQLFTRYQRLQPCDHHQGP
uniref:Uncharacterized protein n=1 Tax=Leersia perrieri TaxID=77586 RepID=A0A0D9XBY3_9ORYZ